MDWTNGTIFKDMAVLTDGLLSERMNTVVKQGKEKHLTCIFFANDLIPKCLLYSFHGQRNWPTPQIRPP